MWGDSFKKMGYELDSSLEIMYKNRKPSTMPPPYQSDRVHVTTKQTIKLSNLRHILRFQPYSVSPHTLATIVALRILPSLVEQHDAFSAHPPDGNNIA